jgi:hypothetical protein
VCMDTSALSRGLRRRGGHLWRVPLWQPIEHVYPYPRLSQLVEHHLHLRLRRCAHGAKPAPFARRHPAHTLSPYELAALAVGVNHRHDLPRREGHRFVVGHGFTFSNGISRYSDEDSPTGLTSTGLRSLMRSTRTSFASRTFR